MNRRRFLSCALVPFVPAPAVPAPMTAIDKLLKAFLAVALGHYEATSIVWNGLDGAGPRFEFYRQLLRSGVYVQATE